MPSSSAKKLRVDQSLDVRGLEAPVGYHAAVQRLWEMAEEGVLELFIDEGEALRTVPFGLRAEGHEIVVSEPANNGVRLLIRKRAPAAT
jgi:TusA-related sulfurtransferase